MSIHRLLFVTICALLMVCGAARAQPVTVVITHGYSLDGTKGGWIQAMGNAMLARAGGGGAICRYDEASGAWRLVSGTIDDAQPIVLIFRWVDDFDKRGASWGYAEGAADALYAALHDSNFIDGGGQPIAGFDLINNRHLHLLGHSRGVIVNSEVCERFAVEGVTVDHVTGMDPHPVNGTLDPPVSNQDWGDPVPKRFNNVTFHDNYWRADGGGLINGFDFDGIPIATAHNVQLSESALNCCADFFAHLDVHLWYHGTVDLATNASDGNYTINTEMNNTWWVPTGRAGTGFLFSRIGGGVAQRPSLPAGEAPGSVPTLYGGTFESNTYAGWEYHGGSVTGTVATVSGRTALRLGAGTGTSSRHNRFYLPAAIRRLVFLYNITAADTGMDDVLRVTFTDTGGNSYILPETLALNATTGGWVGPITVDVPISIPRGLVYTMTIEVVGGAAVNATIALDDFDLHPKRSDFNGDGVVNVTDLFGLLSNWGACDLPCPPICTGDITNSTGDGTDCTVDVYDLFALLAEWN